MERNEITEIVIPEDKDSICRFCLKLSNDLIAVNNCSQDIKWPKAGNLSIEQIFRKLCLKIDDAECLPKKICDECKNCLEDFFIFVEKIESNEEILRNVYSEDVFSSSEDDISGLSFENHEEFFKLGESKIENSSVNVIEFDHNYVQTPKTISISNVENCEGGKILNMEYDYSDLFFSDDFSQFLGKNPVTSMQTNDECQNRSTAKLKITGVDTKLGGNKVEEVALNAHKIRKNKVSEPKVQVKLEEDEPICIKQCFFCERKFSSDDLRTIHYLEHVVQETEGMVLHRLFCMYCGLLTDNKEELDEHIISKHQNEKDLNCVDCEIKFSNADEMEKHVGKHHIENFEEEMDTKIKCMICEKVFFVIDEMMKHSLEHMTGRHACFTCKNVYICGAALNEHLRTHPQYKLKCPICKKRITNRKRALEMHMDTHNTVKNLECEICKRRYSSKPLFSYHMRSHFRPPNICPHCGYKTVKYKNFVEHMRAHTDERPFKCTIENCRKTYRASSSLRAHVRDHLNLKNFACEFCDYKTSRSVSLTIHRRIHTGERPYLCKYCGEKFNRQWNLSRHLKKHHPQ